MNIVIFGAGSAIAQATAREMISDNASLFLLDKDSDHLSIVAADLRTRGAKVYTLTADLSDTSTHADVWQNICRQLPKIDVVLIAYGILGNQKKEARSPEETVRNLQINFVSTASLLTLVAQTLEKQKSGLIAVISSVAGDRGRQSNYVYGSAKGGLTTFLQGLRNRLWPSGVHVLTVKPGFVDTPMTANFKKGLLWVKPEVVGRGIAGAIKRKKSVVYLPWFWRFIMLVIRLIPETVFKRMKL